MYTPEWIISLLNLLGLVFTSSMETVNHMYNQYILTRARAHDHLPIETFSGSVKITDLNYSSKMKDEDIILV